MNQARIGDGVNIYKNMASTAEICNVGSILRKVTNYTAVYFKN